jgi:hypothetical protein
MLKNPRLFHIIYSTICFAKLLRTFYQCLLTFYLLLPHLLGLLFPHSLWYPSSSAVCSFPLIPLLLCCLLIPSDTPPPLLFPHSLWYPSSSSVPSFPTIPLLSICFLIPNHLFTHALHPHLTSFLGFPAKLVSFCISRNTKRNKFRVSRNKLAVSRNFVLKRN